MNTESLTATTRIAAGKGGARKIRQGGKLPCVVYSCSTESLPITIDPAEFEAIFRRTRNPNTLIRLELAEGERLCLVKDVQRHPVTEEVRHVDFYQVDPASPVKVRVPVRTTGTAVGIKMGGSLRLVRRLLEMTCLPAHIPEAITVEVTHLDVGDFVKVSEIEAPEGCTIDYLNDYNVLALLGKRGYDLDDEEEDEEGEEGEGEGEDAEEED